MFNVKLCFLCPSLAHFQLTQYHHSSEFPEENVNLDVRPMYVKNAEIGITDDYIVMLFIPFFICAYVWIADN